jgi:hypothetical protein
VLAGAVVFNDKVGSWNVASVSNMGGVCPYLGRRPEFYSDGFDL